MRIENNLQLSTIPVIYFRDCRQLQEAYFRN